MPMTDKTLIEPGNVGSKAPLKKSTVAWAIGLVMGFALVGYYLPKTVSSDSNTESAEEAKVQTQQPTGTTRQIDAEIERVKPEPLPIPPAAAATVSSVDVELPKHNKAELEAIAAAEAAAAEQDAAARISPSLKFDQSQAQASDAVAGTRSRAVAQGAFSDIPRTNADPVQQVNFDGAQAYARDSKDRLTALAQLQAAAGKPVEQNREWLKEFSQIKPAKALKPTQVESKLTLVQGKVIPAVLGKRLNSDLPGDVTAFTTVDVYDSLSGRNLLIPKGSQLIGEYSNQIRAGQSRVMFAFSRIVLPNGLSYDLPGNKGQDLTGASGVTGDVNNHYVPRFFNGLLLAVLATKVENTTQTQTVYGSQTSRSAAGEVLLEIARSDLSRSKDIPPTITVPQGTRINVQVAADMEFPSSFR